MWNILSAKKLFPLSHTLNCLKDLFIINQQGGCILGTAFPDYNNQCSYETEHDDSKHAN